MDAPTLTNAGGAAACTQQWFLGTNFYRGFIQVKVMDKNANVLATVPATAVQGSNTNPTIFVPADQVATYKSSGLMFQLENTATGKYVRTSFGTCAP